MNCNAHLTDIMYTAALYVIPVGLFVCESIAIRIKWTVKMEVKGNAASTYLNDNHILG